MDLKQNFPMQIVVLFFEVPAGHSDILNILSY